MPASPDSNTICPSPVLALDQPGAEGPILLPDLPEQLEARAQRFEPALTELGRSTD